MTATQKKVVIVGGGYGAIHLGPLLDQHFEVTIIEKRDFFFHNSGSLRALGNFVFSSATFSCPSDTETPVDETHTPKVFIPQNKVLQRGTWLHGEVTELAYDHLVVEHSETNKKEEMHFDYLVIATGSNYRFPGNITTSQSKGQEMFQVTRQRIREAEKILVFETFQKLLPHLVNRLLEEDQLVVSCQERLQ